MYQLLAVFSTLLMLTFFEETQCREHVYGLVSSSPLFHMERHLLRGSDCILDLSDIAGEMNSTITNILESTAMTVVSLQENGTCMIETICDPRVINESMVVKCTNLTFCERNQSNDEYIPLYLKLIGEKPTRKRTPNPRLRCALEFTDETEERYRITTTVAFKVSEGEVEIWELIRLRHANDNRSTDSSVSFEMSKMLRLLPLLTVAFYAPFVLTFFLPTRITQDGLQLINLEGVSPVCVRSAIANCFISNESGEGIIWAEIVIMVCLRASSFIAFVIKTKYTPIFPVVTALCAIVCVNFLMKVTNILLKGERRMVERRECEICDRIGGYQRNLRCQNLSIPERISFHLREQPSIFLLFCNHSYKHLQTLCVHVSNFPLTFPGKLWFFVSLFPEILGTIDGILYDLCNALRDLLATSPLFTMAVALSDYDASRNGHHCFNADKLVFLASFMESSSVLLLITEFIHALIMSAFPILLQEKNLLYFSCFSLSCYYAMENYSAFTKKYQDLGLILFKEYNQPTAVRSRFSPVVIIPQELFDRACEELMPIRNSICELLFGLIISLAPAYIVFVQAEIPEDNVVKGLSTFLKMLFPKIILRFQLTVHSGIKTAETQIKVKKIIADWNIVRA